MVQEYSRHYRDSSLVNDHQSGLDIHDDPCVFPTKELCLYRKRRCHIPFASTILAISETWSSRISIPSSISLPKLLFTPSRDIPSPWPSHMLQHWMHLTEWAQGIFHHADEQIPLLIHTPQHTPLETRETPFQLPYYRVTIDAIKASFGNSD
jgi:hypothetical protein